MKTIATRRRWIRAAVLATWVIMLGWLIRYEAFPDYFSKTVGGYQSLFSRDVLVRDSWMQIEFNDTPIGFSHSTMQMDESHPEARHLVQNRVNVRMNVMGMEQKIYIDTIVRLDDAYDLQAFAFNLSSTGYKLRLDAEREKGDAFRVTMDTGTSKRRTLITVPRDVVLYSPMTEMSMKRLKPGQSLSFRTLDPTSLATTILTVEALRTEDILVGDERHRSTVLSTDYHGSTVLSWIDADGNMLRQETPFGWTMEACTMEQAFEALSGEGKQLDLLADMAVPCDGDISSGVDAGRLRLRLTGVEFRDGELQSARQTVESRDGQTTVLIARAGDRFGARGAKNSPFDPSPYLAPTLNLQCDHEDVRKKADEITAGLATAAEKASALATWVNENVGKEMTVSLPSALDVLRTMKGDCNEHTYLYVALARAVGLPARIMVGLAYHKGAFYYHAWPAVYINGQWYETDPTWGQEAVDAAHIAVLSGDLAQQLELVRVMGQLRIEVLDEGR